MGKKNQKACLRYSPTKSASYGHKQKKKDVKKNKSSETAAIDEPSLNCVHFDYVLLTLFVI